MFRGDTKILVLLLGLVIIRGIIYIALIPPWLGPDEPSHFEAIRLIGQEKKWPTQEVYATTPMHPGMHASFLKFGIWQASGTPPPQGFFSPGGPARDPYIYYYPYYTPGGVIIAGEYPLVYHVLLSPVSALSKSLDITEQLYVLRFCSLLFTMLTVMTGWFFGRTIFPRQKTYALAVVSFLIFLPMFMYINTSVSVDAFVTLLVSLYFLMLAKIFCAQDIFGAQTSLRRFVLAGILLMAAILTKPSALFLIPATLGASIIYLARRRRWKPQLLLALLATLVIVVFIGAILLYQFTDGGRALSLQSLDVDNFLAVRPDVFGPASLAIYSEAVQRGFWSFWGIFASIPIPFSWLRVLWLICFVVGIGMAVFFVEHILDVRGKSVISNPRHRDLFLVLLLSFIFSLEGLYAPVIATQSALWARSQSRYFFPILIPFALCFFLGFRQLLPAKVGGLALPIWLSSFILFDGLAIALLIIPSLYG